MNNETIIEFGFCIIWRIMEISGGVIRLGLRPRRITPSAISIILHKILSLIHQLLILWISKPNWNCLLVNHCLINISFGSVSTVQPINNGHLGDRRKWQLWRGELGHGEVCVKYDLFSGSTCILRLVYAYSIPTIVIQSYIIYWDKINKKRNW